MQFACSHIGIEIGKNKKTVRLLIFVCSNTPPLPAKRSVCVKSHVLSHLRLTLEVWFVVEQRL